jgi:very-short-patch-repair endonuclease
MNGRIGRFSSELRAGQHGLFAVWQLRQQFSRGRVERWLRDAQPPRVHRGVYGEPVAPFGAYMAAVLAMGPEAAISHVSGAELWGMRDPDEEEPIHVSVPGRGGRERRDGFVIHRPVRVPRAHRHGIPVMTPTRCLKDANLEPHELYRALEQADKRWLPVDRPALPLGAIVDLQRHVNGTTRSDAEARLIVLCHDHRLQLPLVNYHLNGFESDFHWPEHRVVLEVDGWEFHDDRAAFERDRRRGLAHRIAGYEVIRASALQVEHEPATVVAALLAAAPGLARRTRKRATATVL